MRRLARACRFNTQQARAENFMTLPAQRFPALDALKGLACMLIVWHHLAFYGPMSDVVRPYAPGLTDWLYDYGRMAVQVFLVVAGFLAAGSLAPHGVARFTTQPFRLIARRYRRLVVPYAVAVAASVLVAALVRPWFDHSSVPAAPTWPQLMAHALLLQDLLGEEALSAGLWYVAIDLQLFVVCVLVFSAAPMLAKRWPGLPAQVGVWLVGVLALLSLFFFNRQPGLDTTALYFFASYALGMLAFWITERADEPMRARGAMALALVCSLALVLDFRERLALAMAVALLLVWLQSGWQSGRSHARLRQRWLEQIGLRSYSIFLIHFPVCVLVNAVVNHFWPTQLLANVIGLLTAFALSLMAGALLYRGVEARGTAALSRPLAEAVP
jgi:peptidoglycan/LPS O-acetylase OafA/YrhL